MPAIVEGKRVAKAMSRVVQSPDLTTPATDPNADVPANYERKAIVTARRPKAAVKLPPSLLPETPEEHKRRGDAADALLREIQRRIAKEGDT